MSLKERWYRFRYHLDKRQMEREGQAKPSTHSIRMLLQHLARLVPPKSHQSEWPRIQIVTKWRTIDGFLQHLHVSAELMQNNKYVLEPKQLLSTPTQIRLYDYFVTEDNHSLTWDEVVQATLRTADRFLESLECSGGNDEIRHDYYMFKYAHLIEALYHFVQVLCDLAVRE